MNYNQREIACFLKLLSERLPNKYQTDFTRNRPSFISNILSYLVRCVGVRLLKSDIE